MFAEKSLTAALTASDSLDPYVTRPPWKENLSASKKDGITATYVYESLRMCLERDVRDDAEVVRAAFKGPEKIGIRARVRADAATI